MTERVLILLAVLLISVGCWVLVFRKSTRYKFQNGNWRFNRLNQEHRETHDAMYLAVVLVMALASSVFFFAALVAALRQ